MENFTQKDPTCEDGSCQIQIMPSCPYCGTSPAKVLTAPFKMGPMLLATVFCKDCTKIITIFPIGVDEPRIQPPESNLVRIN